MSNVPIQIVDEDDRPVRAAPKEEAWEKGLRHRVVWIMLLDGKGNVLLQHRDPSKKLLPDRWDSSVGGHVDEGEDYIDAARREMQEELGLGNIPLQEIGHFYFEELFQGLDMKRFCRVYKGQLTHTPQELEAGGVDDVKWFKLEDAKKLVDEQPDKAAHGLRECINRCYEALQWPIRR